MQLDAAMWVPQSRPRVFVVAVREDIPIPKNLEADGPQWMHTTAVIKAGTGLDGWIWWKLPEPRKRKQELADIIEWEAPFDDAPSIERNLALIPPKHREELMKPEVTVAPGYKRTRASKQVLELRFDGIAGCLRTPSGGSSRQFLVLKSGKKLVTRLLTVRETARLMGAPDTFKLPGSYNDGYKAMGDAVAVPVARHLAQYLLSPLWKAIR